MSSVGQTLQQAASFEQYSKVHVRISKTLSRPGGFDLARAMRVAKKDFFSDTEGSNKITHSQLEVRGSGLGSTLHSVPLRRRRVERQMRTRVEMWEFSS